MSSRGLILATAGLTAACSATLPPVRLGGDSGSIAAMAGEWRGEYASGENGRSGSILFRLSAAGDSAFGDVLMMQRQPAALAIGSAAAPEAGGMARPLTIRFVRIADGRVSGVLDPYPDPDCGCVVTTVFEGTVRGDRVRGTYTVKGSSSTITGRWSAERA